MSDIERAFRAGFQAGFLVSREGFNAEVEYDHCAPSSADKTTVSRRQHGNPASAARQRLEDDAFIAFVATPHHEPRK